jgi:hypothetical protein
MAYKNPIFDYADRHPFLAFLVIPIGMNVLGRAVAMSIRSAKHGSPLSAIMPGSNEETLNLGSIRTEGGDPLDHMFRATARSGPNSSESSEREFVQPQPESRPVRYDNEWRDQIFLNNPNYKSRKEDPSQTSVFAGLSGVNKLR